MKSLLLLLLLQTTTGKVVICTGKKSHVYHSTVNCYGLHTCHWHTELVSVDSAVSLGRTPCKLCVH